MKKLTFLPLLISLFLYQEGIAQQRFSDAKIVYSVQVDLPSDASAQAKAAITHSQLTFYFKNDLFRSEMQVGPAIYTNIHNGRDHSAVILIHSGSSKYLVRMNEEELKKEAKKYAGIVFQDQPGTKEIAGYSCRKAMGKLKDGSTFTVYYSPKLLPAYTNYSPRFEGLKGIPLAFEMNMHHSRTMNMTATKVDLSPQPSILFNVPTSGYRELTYQEMENLRNSR